MRAICIFVIGISLLLWPASGVTNESQADNADISWMDDWENPPNSCRPLQIVHGADLTDPSQVLYYRDECGLGGLVVNVGGKDYIRDADNWKRFVLGVRNIKSAGLRVWIYDELGYPSFSAGGVVLEKDPALESLELVWDNESTPPFSVRPSYEFTHASNSYSESRRYPNPLNQRATDTFLDVTHNRYRLELGTDLYQYVEAFFTDEPSMMAVNLGTIPEENRVNVPIRDPLDPDKKMLPAVPWCDDMEQKYKEKYDEELQPHLISLFTGSSDEDRLIRARFWQLVAELDRTRFYKTIREFCQQDPSGPIASGHTLHEESLLHHVPLDGNKLEVLKEFDMPGLDLLSSNPEISHDGAWITAAFPCSAATLIGQRRVMTEVSDFAEKNYGNKQQVNLAAMEATAAWQAAWGVTEFTLYYQIQGEENSPYRNEACHKAYSLFVGRMNAILRQAQPVRPLLLYYPIEIIQEEYVPTAEKLALESQSTRIKQVINSFHDLANALVHSQIPFVLIDRQSLQEMLADMSNKDHAHRTKATCQDFAGIVYPLGVSKEKLNWPYPSFMEIPASSEETPISPEIWIQQAAAIAGPRLVMTPQEERLTQGAFVRDGRFIFMICNPTDTPYQGHAEFVFPEKMSFDGQVHFDGKGTGHEQLQKMKSMNWRVFDPQNGEIQTIQPQFQNEAALLEIELGPRQSLIYVSSSFEQAK
ncbi:MAG: hypothetical protein Q4G68_13825 [Planctomycetia bacterium]|nr:hypothetical protein [Planctomycetia bacterium]